MKILYITKYFPPEKGGIETLSKGICDLVNKKKDNYIEVLSFSKTKSFLTKKYGYKVHHFRSYFNFFSTPISFRIIYFLFKKISKFDFIHLHVPNPFVGFFLLFFNYKKIVISWGSDIINQKILKTFYYPFQYFLLNKAYKIICLSSEYFKSSKDLKNFGKKVSIIPPIIKSKEKKKYFNKEKINILMIGRLVDYKRHDLAIKSLASLPNKFELNIIGDGKNKGKLNQLIYDLNLTKRAKILDKVNEKKKYFYLKKSDVFLMCSNTRAESFGISILEAISCGLPLVISNVKGSGMNDMIVNNVNGLKFKKNSLNDCVKKLLMISKNKNKLKSFSKNSFKSYKKKI